MLALTCYVLASAMFVVTLYWTERRDTQHWGGNEPPQCRRRQQGLAVTDRRQHPVPDFRDHSLEIVIPAKAGIQYAAAHRLNHQLLWITGSPAFAGDDTERDIVAGLHSRGGTFECKV